jgi:hypothetical protein
MNTLREGMGHRQSPSNAILPTHHHCLRVADVYLLCRGSRAEVDYDKGVLRLRSFQRTRDRIEHAVCHRKFWYRCRWNGIGPFRIAAGAVTPHIDACDAAREWLEIAPCSCSPRYWTRSRCPPLRPVHSRSRLHPERRGEPNKRGDSLLRLPQRDKRADVPACQRYL